MNKPLNAIREPFEQFFRLESSASILLLVATAMALGLANSPFQAEFLSFWQEHVSVQFLAIVVDKPLILWINDGLMAIFFFVIGLEIKREILTGELSTKRKASLPVFAAIGGILVPVLMFKILHGDGPAADGWGVPMATDIAFTLGILQFLGNRVPLGLKVFLTAFAIVDDLAAVGVITIFYSHDIDWVLLSTAGGLIVMLYVSTAIQMYNKYVYFIIAIAVWILFLKSGIHPTVAGVLMAFSIPIRRRRNLRIHVETLLAAAEVLHAADRKNTLLTNQELDAVDALEDTASEIQSPLQHLENSLHGWVSYVIMPLFALANAGVVLSGGTGFSDPLVWQLPASMILGKTLGISLFSLVAVKLNISSLPKGTNFGQIFGLSILGGLGFTMALFIAQLAFGSSQILESAKLGILSGSLIAGILGYLVLRWSLKGKGHKA